MNCRLIKKLSITALTMLAGFYTLAQTYNIKDFGAVGDGKTINTRAIQRAIDSCSEHGGQVIIPAGVFVSGTLHLKSNINLVISQGGTLKGSPYFRDYPDNPVVYKNSFTYAADGKPRANKAFLFAENVHNFSISGKGAIDGSGDSPEFDLGNDDTPASRLRPCMLLIVKSKHIKVNDITLTNSAYWMQNYLRCEYLELKGLSIFNQSNYNQDGIDIDAKHVLIADCKIDADDDGICLKSHSKDFVVEDVVVRNCTIGSNCNAIKFGTASVGGFKNIYISNCTIHRASADHIRHWQKNLQFIGQPVTVISGIAIESVDGGEIDNVHIANLKMRDVQTPIFIVLGNRTNRKVADTSFYSTATGKTFTQNAGKISNITIDHIDAVSYSKMSSSITAFPGVYIDHVQLSNITLNDMGGGTFADAGNVLKEAPGAYPENRMYGQVYPASGLFVRHVKNISLKRIKLEVRDTDHRPSVILDDVLNGMLDEVALTAPAGSAAAIKINNSRGIQIHAPVIKPAGKTLVKLSGTPINQLLITGFRKYKGWVVHSSGN